MSKARKTSRTHKNTSKRPPTHKEQKNTCFVIEKQLTWTPGKSGRWPESLSSHTNISKTSIFYVFWDRARPKHRYLTRFWLEHVQNNDILRVFSSSTSKTSIFYVFWGQARPKPQFFTCFWFPDAQNLEFLRVFGSEGPRLQQYINQKHVRTRGFEHLWAKNT